MSHDSDLPRNILFGSGLEQRFLRFYRKIFSIAEIEESTALKWSAGAFLFATFVSFYRWVGEHTITIDAYLKNDYTCWPYFMSCGKYYFLHALPEGYSQTTLYTAFFGLMLLIVYLMYKKDWVLAHMGLLVLWFWKVMFVFVFAYLGGGNFAYYDIILLFIWLFIPYKLFFLRSVFVLLYFLASTIKIDAGWIAGTYFTSLSTGLPIFGNFLAPVATNIVIFMQMVGSWFLLSGRKMLQRLALAGFIFFHLYSGILVEYRYMATALPVLIILFGLFYEKLPIPRDRKALAGWLLIALLCALQLSRLLIVSPTDQRLTLEGNRFGLFMFEANHQCVSYITIVTNDERSRKLRSESSDAHRRCDPYREWFSIQQLCSRTPDASYIEWKYDHSVNGGPFYRIVDEQNACSLTYMLWKHNSWIKRYSDKPEIIGYPLENIY
ncbi:hypothetical protein A2635_01435 [Candidatus Peribacteria bacterium RIFCSPHIGHO2_01_FULL_51_9]|nr:MAG: hypothetical protein A2635_01435 [Candidatus Peribacteria bacterium RIFCSPHIGHO2_01_FULL_51_9]